MDAPKGSRALFEELSAYVKRGHTVRGLIALYGEKHTGNGITGTPQDIADMMEQWFEARAADGFIVMCPILPAALVAFTELVVPEFRRRGLFRDEYEGTTLRANLGLRTPLDRYAAAVPPGVTPAGSIGRTAFWSIAGGTRRRPEKIVTRRDLASARALSPPGAPSSARHPSVAPGNRQSWRRTSR